MALDKDSDGFEFALWDIQREHGIDFSGVEALETFIAAVHAERHQQTRRMIAALYWRAGRLHMQAQAMCGTPFYRTYWAEYEGVWSAARAMEIHL